MINFAYDFSFLFKIIKYVLIPVLLVVTLTSFIIMVYSKKVKKKDIERYNYLVEFWTTLLAILIVGGLFAVTLGFSISLSNTIRMYDLVKGHELIYYLVLATPILPLVFLIVYVYKIILTVINKPSENDKINNNQEDENDDEDEIPSDYKVDFTQINNDSNKEIDNNEFDLEKLNQDTEEENKDTKEDDEILVLDEENNVDNYDITKDEIDNTNDSQDSIEEEIEIL